MLRRLLIVLLCAGLAAAEGQQVNNSIARFTVKEVDVGQTVNNSIASFRVSSDRVVSVVFTSTTMSSVPVTTTPSNPGNVPKSDAFLDFRVSPLNVSSEGSFREGDSFTAFIDLENLESFPLVFNVSFVCEVNESCVKSWCMVSLPVRDGDSGYSASGFTLDSRSSTRVQLDCYGGNESVTYTGALRFRGCKTPAVCDVRDVGITLPVGSVGFPSFLGMVALPDVDIPGEAAALIVLALFVLVVVVFFLRHRIVSEKNRLLKDLNELVYSKNGKKNL